MSYSHWHYHKDEDGTGWMVIDVDGSSVNILQRPVIEEMDEIVSHIEADSTLTGLCFVSGKHGGFVYGADINEFGTLQTEAEVSNIMDLAHSILSRIEALSIPTATGIN